MPCSSEHMEPTARESELKNVAELLVKMYRLAGGKGPSRDLKDQAAHVYGQGRWDVDHLTAELCIMCSKHEDDIKEACAKLDGDALLIAAWWVRHKAHDKKRGRKRVLDDQQVEEIRHAWDYNNKQWQCYRRNPNRYDEPHALTMEDLAARYRVSSGVIAHVIDKKGAYKDD